jgi:hypothetical protein
MKVVNFVVLPDFSPATTAFQAAGTPGRLLDDSKATCVE